MKITITQPPIPILWLDTWCLLDLARALDSSSPERQALAQNIIDKIISLTRQKKILCPEGDQGIEIGQSNNKTLVHTAQKIQAQLSQGISMHFYASVEHLQTQRMMQALIKKETEVIFPWEDIFMDDIIKKIESKERWLVVVHSNPSPKQTEKTIKTNKSIATAWEKLRNEARKNKQTYAFTLKREFQGKSEAMIHVMADLATKTALGKRVTLSDLLRADQLVGKPLAWWERYSGKQEVVNDVIKFYRSEEFTQIPFVNVGSRLLAELASGNESITASDVMDIHHISTIFPFATYVVVDKRVRNRIERVNLNKEYVCKIIKWQDILSLLESIEK